MKRILTTILSLFLVASISAQQDVTKFMGIPVDGFKPQMIQKLKAKGFTADRDGNLSGEFNGEKVDVIIQTNNNKVWRICLADAESTDETNIKIRFNKLCSQFAANEKYRCLEDPTIPEDEKIGYEMLVNKKRYEAVFYQKLTDAETDKRLEILKEKLLEKYSEEEIAYKGEDIKMEYIRNCVEMESKRSVWFMIHEYFGNYRIVMYYENGLNQANGEDL